jgi:hypothetical protein
MSRLSNKANTLEAGSVLILALLTLLALSLMGVGLSYVGTSQIDIAQTQSTQDTTLSAAETGADVAVNWLKGQITTAIPSAPQTFTTAPLSTVAPGAPLPDPGATARCLSRLRPAQAPPAAASASTSATRTRSPPPTTTKSPAPEPKAEPTGL